MTSACLSIVKSHPTGAIRSFDGARRLDVVFTGPVTRPRGPAMTACAIRVAGGGQVFWHDRQGCSAERDPAPQGH